MVEEKVVVEEKEIVEKQDLISKDEKASDYNKRFKSKVLDKLKNIKAKSKEFKGINLTLIIIAVILVTCFIVFSSMRYNESNLVWDLTRINEDVVTFAETSINDVLIDLGFTLAIILIGYSVLGSIKASMII